MNRQRRWADRKRLQRAVTLEGAGVDTHVASMRNVSLGGAYIETGPVCLPRNARVIVQFELGHRGALREFRMEATVVRTTAHGAGLMFRDTPPGDIERLSEALVRL